MTADKHIWEIGEFTKNASIIWLDLQTATTLTAFAFASMQTSANVGE